MAPRSLGEAARQPIPRLLSRGGDISAQSHLNRTTIHVTETELTDANKKSPSSHCSDESGYYPVEEYIWQKDGSGTKIPPTLEITSIECGELTQTTWRPSIIRVGPLVGIAALLFSLVQTIAAFAVLLAADGTKIEDWKISPSVCLAVLSAISNKALGFAIIQGTVITWWRKAIRREGTTLAQMHRDWGYGMHTYRALLSGRNVNILAIACICATFVAIDGPLLQRASSVGLAAPKQAVMLNVSISPEVPAYYTGWTSYISDTWYYLDYQGQFLPVSRSYSKNEPINGEGAITGCPDTCSATVRAPALVIQNCSSSVVYQDFHAPLTKEEERAVQLTSSPPLDRMIFKTAFWTVNGTTERLVIETVLSDEEVAKNCRGHVNTTMCWLSLAIAEYSVVVTDGIISFEGGKAPSHPPIVALANNTALTHKTVKEFDLLDKVAPGDWLKTTISGVTQAAFTQWYAAYGMVPSSGAGLLVLPEFNSAGDRMVANYKAWDHETACAPGWKDPYDQILGSLNEIMFRTGVYAAQNLSEPFLKSRIDPGLDVSYTVQGIPLSKVNVFQSNFAYFAAAATVELLTITVIACTFHGWWRLGRNVSFSPIEIAKAFDSPLLRTSTVEGYRQAGKDDGGVPRVQYGILRNQGQAEVDLAIAETQAVREITGPSVTAREHFDMLLSRILQVARLRRLLQWAHLAKAESV